MEIFLILYMFFSLGILKDNPELLIRQIIWYGVGFILYFLFKKMNVNKIFRYIFLAYILCNLCLLYLLIFGTPVNGAKAWINFGFISFQPSEFMKIILIILLSILRNKKNYQLILITFIPSILTFLEPDTGNVIFYLLILFTILYSKNKKVLIVPIIAVFFFIVSFVSLYFLNQNLFIDIFGTSFFYRFDRIVNLFNNSSYQLNEALKQMGISFINGYKGLITVPASNTDFAFSSIVIKFGLIGGSLYLLINAFFNYYILNYIYKTDGITKKILICTFAMKLAQETIHILMNIGYFPIMGITLPFISYGGSSIITYLIIFGLINNYNNKVEHLGQDYKLQDVV